MSAVLTLEGVHTYHRPLSHPAGRRFRRARRGRRRCCSAATAPARRRRCARSWGCGAPRRGESRSGDTPLENLAASDVARLGVGYVPETMAVFSDLSVKENLVLGAREGPLDESAPGLDLRLLPGAQEILAVARGRAVRRAEADAVDRARHRRAARAPADRRADQGPRARDRRRADRMPQGDQGDRGDDPAGRAEFPRRARGRRRGSGDGQRPHRPSRRDGATSPPTRRCRTACSA